MMILAITNTIIMINVIFITKQQQQQLNQIIVFIMIRYTQITLTVHFFFRFVSEICAPVSSLRAPVAVYSLPGLCLGFV